MGKVYTHYYANALNPLVGLKPSRADEELPQKIMKAARLFDIKVLDHIIVGEDGCYSFADKGIL